MPEPRTPGQVAYAAYCAHVLIAPALVSQSVSHWGLLCTAQQAAWEAAAEAVRAMREEEERHE